MSDLFKQALKAQLDNKLAEAFALYQQVLLIDPKHKDSLFNVGLIFVRTGDFKQAIHFLTQAAAIEKNAAICSLLGLSYMNTQQAELAIEYYQQAIQFDANEYMAHHHLGILYCQRYQYEKGVSFLQKALTIKPHDYSTLSDLGMALMQQGEHQQAAHYFRAAIQASNYQSPVAYQNLLLCLCFDETAFPQQYLEEAHKLNLLFQSYAKPFTHWPQKERSPTQPLRVGLVCGDINNHPVGYFLETFISQTNRQSLQFFVYDTSHYDDDLSARVKPFIHKWTNIQQMPDEQAAHVIYQDKIHILIDLAGHTAYNKLSLFAFRPAPIQMSFLGYFASTGMSFIDYFISDEISIPKTHHAYFSEKIAYLPNTRLCFSPPVTEFNQTINSLPALDKGHISFGCFQNLSKINHKILKLWKEILNQTPNSKLVILNKQFHDQSVKEAFIKKIIAAEINPQQLILKMGLSRSDYFKAYHDVDFMLDTFPYPGGTTTCEALWMGVPTLTLSGKTLLERQGHSIMANAGLDDWVCYNEKEYIFKAISFAQNTTLLTKIRQELRQNLQHLPIMNATQFAKDFEDTLKKIWQHKDKH